MNDPPFDQDAELPPPRIVYYRTADHIRRNPPPTPPWQRAASLTILCLATILVIAAITMASWRVVEWFLDNPLPYNDPEEDWEPSPDR